MYKVIIGKTYVTQFYSKIMNYSSTEKIELFN